MTAQLLLLSFQAEARNISLVKIHRSGAECAEKNSYQTNF
jgi:hypothetical protein